MATTALTPPSPQEVLPLWLDELQASDRAKGTIRRYKSAVEGFLSKILAIVLGPGCATRR